MQTRAVLLSETSEAVIICLADDDAASRVGPQVYRKRILRYGKWNHPTAPDGVLEVDGSFLDSVVSNFNEGVWDHAYATFGHPANEAEAVKETVGEVIGLEHVQGDGLWALVEIAGEHADKIGTSVKGASSGLLLNYTDHEVGGKGNVGPVLGHLALTNEPYIKGLGAFEPVHLGEFKEATVLAPVNKEDSSMDLEELIAAAKELGIDIPALQKVVKDHEDLTSYLESVSPETPVSEDTGTLVTALAEALGDAVHLSETPTAKEVVTSIAAIVTKAQDAEARLLLSEAETAVDTAVREGKALPAKRDQLVKLYLSDKEMYDSLLPETAFVDFSEHGSEGNLTEANDETIETEITRFADLAKSL